MKWYWWALLILGILWAISRMQRRDAKVDDYLNSRRQLLQNGGRLADVPSFQYSADGSSRISLFPGFEATGQTQATSLIEPDFPVYASDSQRWADLAEAIRSGQCVDTLV